MNTAPGVYGFNWLFNNTCDRVLGSPIVALDLSTLPKSRGKRNIPVDVPKPVAPPNYAVSRDTFLSQPSVRVLGTALNSVWMMTLGNSPDRNPDNYRLITKYNDGVKPPGLSIEHEKRVKMFIDNIKVKQKEGLIHPGKAFTIDGNLSGGHLQYELKGTRLVGDAVKLERRLDALRDPIPLKNLFFNTNHHARFFIKGRKTRSLNSIILNDAPENELVEYPANMVGDGRVTGSWSGTVKVNGIPSRSSELRAWVEQMLVGGAGTSFGIKSMKVALMDEVNTFIRSRKSIPSSVEFTINIQNYQRVENAANFCWAPVALAPVATPDDVRTLAGDEEDEPAGKSDWKVKLGRIEGKMMPFKAKVRSMMNYIVVMEVFKIKVPVRQNRSAELAASKARRPKVVIQKRREQIQAANIRSIEDEKREEDIQFIESRHKEAVEDVSEDPFMDLLLMYASVSDAVNEGTGVENPAKILKAIGVPRTHLAYAAHLKNLGSAEMADSRLNDLRLQTFKLTKAKLLEMMNAMNPTPDQREMIDGIE